MSQESEYLWAPQVPRKEHHPIHVERPEALVYYPRPTRVRLVPYGSDLVTE